METYTGFYKAKFKGLFSPQKTNNTAGKYSFSNIKWELLHLSEILKVPDFNLFESKCDDYLFHEYIKSKSQNKFDPNTEIIFKNEIYLGTGGLKNVLIKNISLPNGNEPMYIPNKSIQVFEMHGDIYFQIIDAPVSAINNQQVKEKVQFDRPFLNFSFKGNINNIENYKNTRSGSSGLVVNEVKERNIRPLKWFIWIFFLCLILHPYLNLILLIGIPLFISSFFKKSSGLSRIVFVLVLLLLLAFGFLSVLKTSNEQTVETKDGNIKVSPPVETRRKDAINGKDQRSKKDITWFDFNPFQYDLSYSTSAHDFINTQKSNERFINQLEASSQNEAFEKIYQYLSDEDKDKLDSLINSYKQLAIDKNLNQFQTAEMVCTFIQEIPYCLVHQNTCEEFLRQNQMAFVQDYHKQGKPCLPNVPAGVQSPYEFVHNLKGDCDTRTLYAFTILKAFKIPCSIWVSDVYGHSILGVGLPNSNGFYKEVYGTRHYGVELTAKGYRIGMIAGEQKNPKNWNVALSYNH